MVKSFHFRIDSELNTLSSFLGPPFPFLHVYGELAKLPWQDKKSFPYGLEISEVRYDFLENLKNNIRVIHDRSDEKLYEAKRLIRRAGRIFFLGFGFHNENLKVLGIPNIFKHGPKIYGTAFRATKKQINDILTKLIPDSLKTKQGRSSTDTVAWTKGDISINIENKSCNELLEEYL
jgi:hypothetical protein